MKARGEKHPSAKLTEEKVLELREMRRQGMAYWKLARIFGISDRTAYRIATGSLWSHVNGYRDTKRREQSIPVRGA